HRPDRQLRASAPRYTNRTSRRASGGLGSAANPSSLIAHPESLIRNPYSGPSGAAIAVSGPDRLRRRWGDGVAAAVGEARFGQVLDEAAHHFSERLAELHDPLKILVRDMSLAVC